MPDVQNKIKAAHKRKSADVGSAVSIAGKRFHFIGVGGIGMSGLAKLLIKHSGIVTGSDQTTSAVIDKLLQLGADIKIGHHENNLNPQTDAVVISAAIKEDNPELKLARKKGLKVYKYAQMLGLLCSRYYCIAVAGTHGKSTTSGWLVYLLKQAGLDPNFTIGAEIIQLAGSSGVGEGKYFVAEACEYDRSFLNLKPQIACILNIEADHLDYYKDEEEIVDAFGEFAGGIKQGGVLIASGSDQNVAKVISEVRSQKSEVRSQILSSVLRCETFGFNENCDFSAQNLQLVNGFYAFDVFRNGKLLAPAKISLPGRHNILNALAVVAAAVNIGLPTQQIFKILGNFTGIDRRLMLKEEIAEVTIIDDYAHHPTEIKASLEAIRQRYQPKRIWCIFQPHQYSRTRFLLDDFAQSFKLADITIVPEIYFVRDSQQAKKEINSKILVERIRDNKSDASFIDGFGKICDHLKRHVKPGDLVVTMGAGDIWKVADEYIQWLRKNS